MGQIVEAAEVARLAAAARGEARPVHSDLDLGSRQASSSRLGELASRLPPGYKWEDLVVPDRQLDRAVDALTGVLLYSGRKAEPASKG